MNWGKGIAIAIGVFIIYIASFVYIAFTKDADLIRDDYYENELAFDDTKAKRLNYKNLAFNVEVEQNENGVKIRFPQDYNEISGSIFFYRPDKKKYDRSFDLNLDNIGEQVLAYDNFKEGYYDLSIDWKDKETEYLFETSIQF